MGAAMKIPSSLMCKVYQAPSYIKKAATYTRLVFFWFLLESKIWRFCELRDTSIFD